MPGTQREAKAVAALARRKQRTVAQRVIEHDARAFVFGEAHRHAHARLEPALLVLHDLELGIPGGVRHLREIVHRGPSQNSQDERPSHRDAP